MNGIMKTNKLILSFCLVAAMLLVSCGPVKDIAYFQNRMVDHPEKIDKAFCNMAKRLYEIYKRIKLKKCKTNV